MRSRAAGLGVPLSTPPGPPEGLDLARFIRPGDTVLVGQGTGEPRTLTEALVRQRALLGGIRVFLGASYGGTFRPEHADHLHFLGIGGMAGNAVLTRAGVLDVLPCHISALPGLISTRRLAVDVVLVQVAPSGPDGAHSLGLMGDYLTPAIARARTVIAEINEQVPRTVGPGALLPSQFDASVHSSREPATLSATTEGPAARRIGELVAGLIPDGAVLQLGVGAVPQAVARGLSAKRDLSVHSGLVGDWIIDLHDSGVVTNAGKPIDTGVSITGGLLGSARLSRFADGNPQLQLRPITYTHDPQVLRRLPDLIAVNAAVEVDLSGQVNAETLGGHHIGAVGGQVDFVRAAAASPGGRSVIALPATARGGTVSRIVVTLPDGVVTTARSDTELVVTEYGVADLRGLPLRERAAALIAVAHPQFREDLMQQLAERGDLY